MRPRIYTQRQPQQKRAKGSGAALRVNVKAPSASVGSLRKKFNAATAAKKETKNAEKRAKYAEENSDLPHYTVLKQKLEDFVDDEGRFYYIADRKEFAASYGYALEDEAVVFVLLPMAITRKRKNDFAFPSSSIVQVYARVDGEKKLSTELRATRVDFSRPERAVGVMFVEGGHLLSAQKLAIRNALLSLKPAPEAKQQPQPPPSADEKYPVAPPPASAAGADDL